jgi:hypothetical protein
LAERAALEQADMAWRESGAFLLEDFNTAA